MDKIEEIARALFEAASSNNGMSFASYDDMPEAEKELCRIEVRAVLTAILPPSEAMVEAGCDACWPGQFDKYDDVGPDGQMRAAFTAMIQAVLEGK